MTPEWAHKTVVLLFVILAIGHLTDHPREYRPVPSKHSFLGILIFSFLEHEEVYFG